MTAPAADMKRAMREKVTGWGGSLVGVAELPDGVPGDFLSPAEIGGLCRACSVAVRLSDRVLEGITDGPTRLYLHHYRQVNYLLDGLALRLAGWLQGEGHAALAIPASQMLDWEAGRGHLSHRRVAVLAGLGWIGRHNLLVTQLYGARVRLVTVLTDAPLEPDPPLDEDCGSCRSCAAVCPADAIREDPVDFDMGRCSRQLREFRNGLKLGHDICGICVRACDGSACRGPARPDGPGRQGG